MTLLRAARNPDGTLELWIPWLYTGGDERSRWGEVLVSRGSDSGDWGSGPRVLPGANFRHASADFALDWHPAPLRQYVVTITGEVEYVVGNGERRRFGPGSIFLADDLTGQGHISRGVGTADRMSLYIPVHPEETLVTSTSVA